MGFRAQGLELGARDDGVKCVDSMQGIKTSECEGWTHSLNIYVYIYIYRAHCCRSHPIKEKDGLKPMSRLSAKKQ